MKIGTEEFTIQRESKKAMDVEIILVNVLVYAVTFIYAFDYLSWPVFYLLFHHVYMSYFMGTHDRFHADQSKHWPRPIEFFAEYFALVAMPWAEPLDSIRKKHFTHHKTHRPKKTPGYNILQDPHSIYEGGGFWRALFYCTFFEEAQLLIDIRNKNVAKSRWIRLAIYLPLQILFFMIFGWEKYLGVFLAVRLMSTIAWFTFSRVAHTSLYRFGLLGQIPRPFILLNGLINGKRVMDGFFCHTSHHAWPSIPSSKLYLLDEAVMRNPDAMPEMIPTS